MSFILVCTKKGAGFQESNAWIASGSAESSWGHPVLLSLECTSILHRYFRSANCTTVCKAWSKSLVECLKKVATMGGSHTHINFA